MTGILFPVSALLLGAAIILAASGLQGVLLPVRATMEGFSVQSVAIIGAAYSVGFTVACWLTPYMVRRVGHIRSFAVMSAVGAAAILVMGILVVPWAWIGIRAVTGFCLAGVFTIIESWLNEHATNQNRGTLYSIYMIINLGGVTSGQMALALMDPETLIPFVIAGIAFSLALVPTALSTRAAPTPPSQVRLRLAVLYRNSPVAVVGCICVGLANGAFGTLAAVSASTRGFTVTETALFVSAALLGGALVQIPLGRLSDHVDRRKVVLGTAGVAVVSGVGLYLLTDMPPWVAILAVTVLGAGLYPLYSLLAAHANDHASSEDFVETASGLLMLFGIGSILGPLAASAMIDVLGQPGLFLFVAAINLLLIAFALTRVLMREGLAYADKIDFVANPAVVVSTPEAYSFDPRAPETDFLNEEELVLDDQDLPEDWADENDRPETERKVSDALRNRELPG